MPFTTKQKIFLTVIFLVSLLPKLTTQFGIDGLNAQGFFFNLGIFGIIAILIYLISLWTPLGNKKIGKILGLLGTILVVVGEIVSFVYADSPNSYISIKHSFEYATPMFFLGFFTSLMMVFIYGCVLSMTKAKSRRRK